MSFNNKLYALNRACLDLLTDADKEELTYDPKLKASLKNCKSLLTMLMGDTDKSERIMGKFSSFFTENFSSFTNPFMVEVEGERMPAHEWILAGDKTKGVSGWRGLVLIPNEKRPNVCIPVSEIYELALDLIERNEKEYGFYVPRVVYLLLTAMSSMKVKDKDGETIDTEDIDLVAIDLEDDAKIQNDMGVGDVVKGLKDFDPTSMMKNMQGAPINDIIEKLGSFVKGGAGNDIKKLMNTFTSVMSGSNEADVNPDEQS